MKSSVIFSCMFALCAAGIQALGLIETLELIGAAQFALFLESDPALLSFFTSSAVQTIFAPIDGSAWSKWGLSRRAEPTLSALYQVANDVNAMGSTTSRKRSRWATCATENVRDAPVETYLRQRTIGNQSVVPDCESESDYKLFRRGGYHSAKPTPTSVPPYTASSPPPRPSGTRIPGLELTAGLGIRVDVVEADIYYDNGIIHLMADWFTVPQSVSETLKEVSLTSFLDLIRAAGLLDSLNARSGITIFAPTNEALAAYGNLSKRSKQELKQLVYAHVVPNQVLFHPYLTDGLKLETLAGTEITVTLEKGEIYINDAKIVVYDYITDNGVIHSIDKVLEDCPPEGESHSHEW